MDIYIIYMGDIYCIYGGYIWGDIYGGYILYIWGIDIYYIYGEYIWGIYGMYGCIWRIHIIYMGDIYGGYTECMDIY